MSQLRFRFGRLNSNNYEKENMQPTCSLIQLTKTVVHLAIENSSSSQEKVGFKSFPGRKKGVNTWPVLVCLFTS